MGEQAEAMQLLRSLGDFDDPTGSACRIQIETLEAELRESAIKNPDLKFRMHEDGPEQTAAEILVEFEAEETMIAALREATKLQKK